MARLAIVLAGAICFLSLAQVAISDKPKFIVKGKVYCDICRAGFVTKFSKPMPGAEVKLECRESYDKSAKVTYCLTGGVTDDKGEYRLEAEGDHGEEYCEVTMVKSSQHDCDEIPIDGSGNKLVAEIQLNANRHATPLSYTTKKRAPECEELKKWNEEVEEDEPAEL